MEIISINITHNELDMVPLNCTYIYKLNSYNYKTFPPGKIFSFVE